MRPAAVRGFGWTILRPQLVVGPTYGVAMNLVPVIGALAAICREEGLPFGFPGGASYVTEAVDVRIVARAALWAATAPAAHRDLRHRAVVPALAADPRRSPDHAGG